MPKKIYIVIWLISILIFSSSILAENISTLLEEGIYAEETKGDLDEAMTIYQKIIDENAGNSANIAEAYYLALKKCRFGEVYNICSGKTYSIKYILDTLLGMTDKKIKVNTDTARFRKKETTII